MMVRTARLSRLPATYHGPPDASKRQSLCVVYNRSMIRQIVTVSTGTLASRVLGFGRDALIAALLGAGAVADAFLFAFQLINVARRLLNEGALNAALVPTYLRIRDTSGDVAATAFAGRLIGTLGLILIVVAVVLGLAMPTVVALLAPGFKDTPSFQLAIDAARLMLPYIAFAAPVAVLSGVLNARHQYGFTSSSPAIFNVTIITVIMCLMLATADAGFAATTLAIVIGISGIMQLALLASPASRLARPIRVSFSPQIRHFLRKAAPGMIAQAGPQLMLVAGSVVASSSPAAVSWLYFASRLVELPLGIVGSATGTVLISKLSDTSSRDSDLTSGQSRALELALGLALPATFGLAILAQPIVSLLFENGAFTASDVTQTALALSILAFSLPGHVLSKMFGAMFFAYDDTMAPFIATLIGLIVTILTAWLGFPAHGYLAVAGAITAGATLSAILLGLRLAAVHGLPIDRPARRNLALIGLSSIGMGLIVAAGGRMLPGDASQGLLSQIFSLTTLIALGLFSYALLLRLFGVLDFALIRRAFGSSSQP